MHSQNRNIKPLKEKNPEPSAEINVETAQEYGIRNGELIVVEMLRG
ncbi:MAG: hypothetical protein GTN74_06015 [Proteobacteria bacterium]|nr:hypothetical protein [Pseudomonadota bacterium]NIS69104.1 hypothetical protein [Pseudomonadota bacterium]